LVTDVVESFEFVDVERTYSYCPDRWQGMVCSKSQLKKEIKITTFLANRM